MLPHRYMALSDIDERGQGCLTTRDLYGAIECSHAAIKHGRVEFVNTTVIRSGCEMGVVTPNLSTVGKRIAHARGLKRWTQQQLADAAGVSQSTIGNLEAETRARPRHLLQISEALGVSAVWVEFGKGVMLPENPRLRPEVGELAALIDSQLSADQVEKLRELVLSIAPLKR